ncbi:efflux RND transporter periplasmic adaptor subunit [Mucilaginibacter sp. Bleaf8]|uniref:efflux RND transporter periplasmic adaptor subunit n=1 Tax=Mucilaginibacter sp. Bleaf8 TaxID=2834430 RepID=UPI001BCDAD61|nr:efflux RND transporter periplasmic adaptor subunit [Mucilaginibacter sp. Bleaf8]MBS7564855.1 efflux RND transporter periplasmic adaptor subunit [Mucilaginibacter sp. Bleaf8]
MKLQNNAWLFALLMLTACGHKKEDDRSDAEASGTAAVAISTLNMTAQNQVLNFSGTIQAEKTAQVAFSVQGRVTSVLVDEGQAIKKGQLLATIDPRDYQYQLEQADASLLQAKDTYMRNKQLYEKGSLTPAEFVRSESQYLTAQANRKTAAKRVGDTRLYAPISGTVTQKATEVGVQAAPSAQAFTIASIDKVNAVMTIPETEIGNVMRNNTAEVNIPTLNEAFSGKVTSVNPQAERTSNTFRTKILLSNPQHRLLPGMIAEIKVNTNHKSNYITIPPKAVVHDQDDISYVFLVDSASNRAIRRRITIGQAVGDQISVSEGLKTGDKLVIEGQTRLRDGQHVQIK